MSHYPVHYLLREVYKRTNLTVQQGPFTGLRYARPEGNAVSAKLLGLYEKELYSIFAELQDTAPWTVLDIGSAEGFFSLGLARFSSVRRVISFEMLEAARQLQTANARLNRLEDKVALHGECTDEQLQAALSEINLDEKLFVLCDVEGCEGVLLDPGNHPRLKAAHILVEVHDILQPGIASLLTGRFEHTHTIHRIDAVPRKCSDYPYAAWHRHFFKDFYYECVVSDLRPEGMFWYWMVPRP